MLPWRASCHLNTPFCRLFEGGDLLRPVSINVLLILDGDYRTGLAESLQTGVGERFRNFFA